MPLPNILSAAGSPTLLFGMVIDTAVLLATDSEADLISAVPTDHSYRIESIFCANIHETATGWVTVIHKKSAANRTIAYRNRVQLRQTIDALKGTTLYMAAGDSLVVLASAVDTIQILAPFVDIDASVPVVPPPDDVIAPDVTFSIQTWSTPAGGGWESGFGSGMDNVSQVFVDGVEALGYDHSGDTIVQFYSPGGAAGVYNIEFISTGGTSTFYNKFTYT